MSHPPQGAPFIHSLITTSWLARCAYTAAALSIPDFIGDREMTSIEVAQHLAASEDFTFRCKLPVEAFCSAILIEVDFITIVCSWSVLRALASGNIFEEVAPRRFKNNESSQSLRKGSPLRDMLLLSLGQSHSRSWLELVSALKTGKSGVMQAYGMDFWKL